MSESGPGQVRTDSPPSAAAIRGAALGLSLALLAACVASPEPALNNPAGPEPQPEVEVDSPFGNYLAGRFARANKDIHAAADFYARALAQDPDNLSLLRRTFSLTVADGRIDEAIPLASRIQELSPASGSAALVLALSDFNKGDYEAVLARMENVPRSGFDALLVPLISAWAQAGQNQFQAAVAALGPLSESESFAPTHAFHTALIQDFAGDKAAAEKAYGEVMEAMSGGTLRIVEAFGAFLERAGRRNEAREHYLDYLSRNPEEPMISDALARLEKGEVPAAMVADAASGVAEALFDVANALARDRARDTARQYIQLTLYMRPDLELARTLLGELFETERRWEDALDVYRQISPSSPYGWNARLRVASSLDRVDRTDEAVAILREMAAHEPERRDALITLADILRGRERYQEAVVAYDRVIERTPTLAERHWSLLYARGVALERSHQWPRAEADFLRALELKPDQPLVLNYLGYSWVDQGANLERALEMIEKAVELRPNDGYIVDSLGWAHYRLGKYEEAVVQLERAVALRPQDPTINDHLGDAYWRVGRVVEARFQWRRALSFDPDQDLIPAIEAKLEAGLAPPEAAGEGS